MRIYVFMKEKKEKKRSWYKRGGYKSVIFVPATPDSQLKKELEQDINESGVKIKVAERAGKYEENTSKIKPGRDAMLRQISESVRISREKPEELINNKTEWNYVHIPRASFSR
ncbi:hypothetical protein QZH41_010139 [Actinostola sp. cb2023]|nr:hypothetical protein QZH41_010139 [Actinostola sp. cb2023]